MLLRNVVRANLGVALLLAASLTAPVALRGQGWIAPPFCPTGRCPIVTPAVERTSSRIRATLNDKVIEYEVRETFVNRGALLGEADYYFPLPTGASFQDLQLSIGGKLVFGETMDADKARHIYEETVRRNRDPALVEWMGHGLLHMRIFPIAPGEVKTVVVRFQAVAQREGDALRVDYVRGTAATAPRKRNEEPLDDFVLTYPTKDGFGTAYSPTHQVVARESNGQRTVELIGSSRAVTVLVPVRHGTGAAISMLPFATGGEDGFALITLSPPEVRARAVSRDVTFVLDISGSMQGAKMTQAREAGKALLATLSPKDRFRIIDFSSDVRTFRDSFVVAGRREVEEATRYLESLQANGGTNIMGALRAALDGPATTDRLPLVLFVTDGMATVGETSPEAIAAEAGRLRKNVRVFTFGLGADVNLSLLEQLAIEGRGTAQFVRPEESVERAVSLVASRLAAPRVTDVRVTASGVRLSRLLPGDATDIFAGQDLVLLARYAGRGRSTLRFTGRTDDGPVSWTADVDFPERARENPFVARLWATQRVGFLTAANRTSGASAEVRDEIKTLGEKYGIPTPYTSYLVQEPTFASPNMGTAKGAPQQSGGFGVAGGVAAAPSATRGFESARAASAQRSALSLSAADAASDVGASVTVKRVGARTLVRKDSVWTDSRWSGTSTSRTIQLRAYSAAYFDLLARIADLPALAAAGDRVRVAGRAVQIEFGPSGRDTLTAAELATIVRDW